LNKKVLGKGFPKLNPKLKQKLMKYYELYNQELYSLIGRDLEWEKEI